MLALTVICVGSCIEGQPYFGLGLWLIFGTDTSLNVSIQSYDQSEDHWPCSALARHLERGHSTMPALVMAEFYEGLASKGFIEQTELYICSRDHHSARCILTQHIWCACIRPGKSALVCPPCSYLPSSLCGWHGWVDFLPS